MSLLSHHRRAAIGLAVTLLTLAAGVPAVASLILQPPGLNEGDQYRLVFVTSGPRNALTSSVGPFNDFVTAQANAVPELAALGTTWKAIVSSATFGANENSDTGGPVPGRGGLPIFRLDGVRVADDYDDLWDGTIDAPISITELGSSYSGVVWTGSDSAGDPEFPLKNDSFLVGVGTGLANSTNASWIFKEVDQIAAFHPVYAISGTLTATATVPEPASTVLLCFLAIPIAVGMQCSRRRSRRASPIA